MVRVLEAAALIAKGGIVEEIDGRGSGSSRPTQVVVCLGPAWDLNPGQRNRPKAIMSRGTPTESPLLPARRATASSPFSAEKAHDATEGS